mgnify:FL=1
MLRFLFDGVRIDADETPKSLDLDDGDQIKIDCEVIPMVTTVIVDENGQQNSFKMLTKTPMTKVFDVIAEKKSGGIDSLRFLYKGRLIFADSTPETLNLKDQDRIDCLPWDKTNKIYGPLLNGWKAYIDTRYTFGDIRDIDVYVVGLTSWLNRDTGEWSRTNPFDSHLNERKMIKTNSMSTNLKVKVLW